MNGLSVDVDAIVREVAERLAVLLGPRAADSAAPEKNGTSAAACGCVPRGRSGGVTATPTAGTEDSAAPAGVSGGAPGTIASTGSSACGCRAGKAAGESCGCKHDVRRLELYESVITVASLSGRLAGVQEVHVPPRAIVTPAANDLLREAGAVLVRSRPNVSHSLSPTLVLGAAETPWGASNLISALTAAGVGVEQLARVGLRETVDELADHACRGGRRCVLLTARPYLGACLANRRSGVRAVAIVRMADAQGAVVEAAANMAVLDPAAWSTFALHRFVQWFATSANQACPHELRHEEG